MEGESNEPRKFSYPNSDRTPNESGEITGPNSAREKLTQEQLRQTIHIADALGTQPSAQKPLDMQNIKTFQSELANAVKTDNVSMIKIALAEKKRQEKQGTYDQTLLGSPSSSSPLFYIVGIIIVIALVGGGLYIFKSAIFNTSTTDQKVDGVSIYKPSFETEGKITVDVNGKDFNDIERLVQAEKTKELSMGSMQRMIFIQSSEATSTKKELTSAEWLTFLNVRAPEFLLRAFEPGFIFGTYSFNKRDTFIIFKVNSFDNAFAGMLQWEPTLESDLGGFVINKNTATTTTETSTSSVATRPNSNVFTDRIINNKDTRVLLDENGNIKMLYTFIDQTTLLITSSEIVLKEAAFRLTTGRIVR